MSSEAKTLDQTCISTSGAAEAMVPSLEIKDVRRLVWEGVVLLDARSSRDHIRSPHQAAIHLCHRAPQRQLLSQCPDPSLPVVCCSNGEHRARRLAHRYRRLGYRHVYVLRGGFDAVKAQLLD